MSKTRIELLEETLVRVAAVFKTLPEPCQPHLGNALLNLALGRLVEEHGQMATAQLLARVQDSLSMNECPATSEAAIDCFRLDS